LTDVTTDRVITKEETFGPVAPLYRLKINARSIEKANRSENFCAALYALSQHEGVVGVAGINKTGTAQGQQLLHLLDRLVNDAARANQPGAGA
jgi:acyl-CoA reductase-like NAD-dependent aldehyde dehydrogenase